MNDQEIIQAFIDEKPAQNDYLQSTGDRLTTADGKTLIKYNRLSDMFEMPTGENLPERDKRVINMFWELI